jgi:hypothetical protein
MKNPNSITIIYRDSKMEYRTGKVSRVITARLFEGEELYQCLESLAEKENIKTAAVLITGGFRDADVVAGPKQEKPEIVGDKVKFEGPGEVLGVGTIYPDEEDNSPKLHIHTAAGKGGENIVGCPRGGARIFLTLEVTILEFEGISAARKFNKENGLKLLRFD